MGDEVLIHISTPATRQNDELFRSLANAYTTFEPQQVHCDESARRRKSRRRRKTNQPNDKVRRSRENIAQEAANATLTPATKESHRRYPPNVSSEGKYDAQVPASDIDASMHSISRLAQLDRSYLSWRKRVTPRSSFTRVQQDQPNSSSGPEDADTGFIEDSQSALAALQSQLLDTYSTTSQDTSEDENVQGDNPGTIQDQLSQRLEPNRTEPAETMQQAQSPTLPRNITHATHEETLPEDAREPLVNASRTRTEPDPNSSQVDFSALPPDAFSPPPTMTVTCPGTLPSQVTKHLAAIKIKNPDRYKPLRTRRPLDADERGYWHVDCTQWSPRIQQDFWTSLYEHICSGRVGWATTLHRETELGLTLRRVRLYCWGEVVEHMWLLLWLCSKGKMSNSGSKWMDANGVAVVEMA